MNLKLLFNFGNMICAHVDFAKLFYKTLDICSQQNDNNNNNNNKIHSTCPMFIFLNKLSEATASIFKFTTLTL